MTQIESLRDAIVTGRKEIMQTIPFFKYQMLPEHLCNLTDLSFPALFILSEKVLVTFNSFASHFNIILKHYCANSVSAH